MKYYKNIVSDLKDANPGKWHSKLKRMCGQKNEKQKNILVEELMGYTDQEQADMIAQQYAAVSNQYDAIKLFALMRSNLVQMHLNLYLTGKTSKMNWTEWILSYFYLNLKLKYLF